MTFTLTRVRTTYVRFGPLSIEFVDKSCVIVTPYFPPSTLAGVHRARHLAKHLPAAGWTPIVLCVDERYHEERLDPGLASLVPIAVEIVKVPAVPAWLSRSFGLGEISLRAWRPLRRQLFHLLKTRHVDAVLITGSPYYPMLLASDVKQRFNIPVVLDFQDPWVSAWGATQPRWSKSGLSHSLATFLEPRALHGASFVTSVSETQNAQMAARYPWLDRKRMTAVPIGADPEDFSALQSMDQKESYVDLDPSCIHISYVGTVWPKVVPTIDTLLRAVARLRRQSSTLTRRLRLNFIGTTADPNDPNGYRVLPLAETIGVEDLVREVPQRVPYLDALSILASSDVNLILGSDEPHYTASKSFSVLMSGRPFLSIFHQASSAHEILSAAGGGVAIAFASATELEAMEGVICDSLARLVGNPETLGQTDRAALAPYEAANIARRFSAVFEGLTRE